MYLTQYTKNLYPKNLWIFLFVSLLIFNTTQAATILNVRVGTHKNFSRIVFEVDDKIQFKSFILHRPERIVFDFASANTQKLRLKSNFPKFIKNVRYGRNSAKVTRFVFTTDESMLISKHNIIPQKSGAGKIYKYVFDFVSNRSGKKVSVLTSPEWRQKASSLPANIPSGQKALVVIDPGHGGKDVGAVGKYKKSYEKHINLKIALKISKLAKQSKIYNVLLTRSNDKFIELKKRYTFAQLKKADLFISLHADSTKSRSAKGAGIYIVSEQAAAKHAQLLLRSNDKNEIISGIDLGQYNPLVTDLLVKIQRRHTVYEAAEFSKVLKSLLSKHKITMRSNTIRLRGFAVLKSITVPSVLFEMGFISNSREEKLLNKNSYQQKIANITHQAIIKYLTDRQNFASSQ